MPDNSSEPRRIRSLRRDLIKIIPRFPNNRASLTHMQNLSLSDLLMHYINWRSRYVGQRPRSVEVDAAALLDERWSVHRSEIENFLTAVRDGADLDGFLSDLPNTKGYTPASGAPGATLEERWSDKDLILNAMAYFHFHIGPVDDGTGRVDRSNDLLFARVTREEFRVIAIFDHSVFDSDSSERGRLRAAHEAIVAESVPPGSFYLASNVASSGHSINVVRYALSCARRIRTVDPQLDDQDFMTSLYRAKQDAPAKSRPAWGFWHLDLCVFDRAKPAILILQPGWN